MDYLSIIHRLFIDYLSILYRLCINSPLFAKIEKNRKKSIIDENPIDENVVQSNRYKIQQLIIDKFSLLDWIGNPDINYKQM